MGGGGGGGKGCLIMMAVDAAVMLQPHAPVQSWCEVLCWSWCSVGNDVGLVAYI